MRIFFQGSPAYPALAFFFFFKQVFFLVLSSESPRKPEEALESTVGSQSSVLPAPGLPPLSVAGVALDADPCPQKGLVFRKP